MTLFPAKTDLIVSALSYMWDNRRASWYGILLVVLAFGCGPSAAQIELKEVKKQKNLIQIEYQEKTQALLDKSKDLQKVTSKLEEQQWRLKSVCSDHEDHHACAPYTDATKAREAFCNDRFFVKHVDLIINSCHQGQCMQVDSAQQINRSQYMLLTRALPHSLITFKANQTKLDRRDKKQIQGFLELLDGEKGYVIIVGRASKDGQWRKNVKLAIDRAEKTRSFIVDQMGLDKDRVGYITYGDEKMYLTELDIKRLGGKKLSVKQANRSALIFSYPCFDKK